MKFKIFIHIIISCVWSKRVVDILVLNFTVKSFAARAFLASWSYGIYLQIF